MSTFFDMLNATSPDNILPQELDNLQRLNVNQNCSRYGRDLSLAVYSEWKNYSYSVCCSMPGTVAQIKEKQQRFSTTFPVACLAFETSFETMP